MVYLLAGGRDPFIGVLIVVAVIVVLPTSRVKAGGVAKRILATAHFFGSLPELILRVARNAVLHAIVSRGLARVDADVVVVPQIHVAEA